MWMFWWSGIVKKPALRTRLITIDWLFMKSRKHLSAKCQKDLAANIQTWPLLVHKPATIKAGRKFDSYEQYLAHFMYCVPRLGWALRPLQSASHARIPSMKSGCFSSNLSNACPQALHSLEARAQWRLAAVLECWCKFIIVTKWARHDAFYDYIPTTFCLLRLLTYYVPLLYILGTLKSASQKMYYFGGFFAAQVEI